MGEPVTFQSSPGVDKVWMTLRALFGTSLQAATLTVMLERDGKVGMETIFFPAGSQKSPDISSGPSNEAR